MNLSLIQLLSVVIALGLLNVWLIRAKLPTAYRGAQALNLKEEFSAYGLPPIVFYIVGALKIGAALALLAGLWFPPISFPAALLIAILMLGAVAMHFKVRDPLKKALPAALMLLMSVIVCSADTVLKQ